MNPFTDWKPEQQCFGIIAVSADGSKVMPTARNAVRWCATGRMWSKGIDYDQRLKFHGYLEDREFAMTEELNDDAKWTPAQFAAAWDEFEKERHDR